MVGSPYQRAEHLANDLLFIKELSPHMIGIGPFIPHKDTKFADFPAGSVDLTLFLIGLLRLMLPSRLLFQLLLHWELLIVKVEKKGYCQELMY